MRLNTLKLDSHVLCITCRGKNCSITDRCVVCSEWSDGDLNTYVKLMARLERESANNPKLGTTLMPTKVL